MGRYPWLRSITGGCLLLLLAGCPSGGKAVPVSPPAGGPVTPTPTPVPTNQGKTVAAWGKELADPDPRVREAAAEALAQMGPEVAEVVPALTGVLADESVYTRMFAAHALSLAGPHAAPAIPDLCRTLVDPDRDVRDRSEDALEAIGRSARPALEGLVSHQDGEVRCAALRILGHHAEAALDTSDTRKALGLEDPGIARAARMVADEVAKGPDGSPPFLEHALSETVESDARWARETVLPLLAAGLEDEETCLTAIHALDGLGAAAEPALPALKRIVADAGRRPLLRESAREAMERIAGEVAPGTDR